MARRGRPNKTDKAVYNKGESAAIKGATPYIDYNCNFNELLAYKNAELVLKQFGDTVLKYKGSIEFSQSSPQPVLAISGYAMDCALASILFEKSVNAYVEIGIQLASARDTARKDFYKQGHQDKTKPAIEDLAKEVGALKVRLTPQKKNKILKQIKNLETVVEKAGEEYADNAECATKTYLRELEDYTESLKLFIDEGLKLEKKIKELDGTAFKLGVRYTVGYCKILLKTAGKQAEVMKQQVSFQKGLQELGDAVKG